MKQYCLKISSKNEKSLKNFRIFIFKYLKTKFNIIQKSGHTYKNTQIITLLKSPHVNKTAQEHFEVRIFTKHFFIVSFSSQKHFIILKKILNKLFQDISIRLEFTTDKFSKQENNKLTFYPDNFKVFLHKHSKTNIKRYKRKDLIEQFHSPKNYLFSLKKLLKTLSIFGEILILSSKKILSE